MSEKAQGAVALGFNGDALKTSVPPRVLEQRCAPAVIYPLKWLFLRKLATLPV